MGNSSVNRYRGYPAPVFLSVGLLINRAAPADTAAAITEPAKLQEILVTATKRTENMQNVPQSIVAVPESVLQIAGVKNIDDVAALTPGVQFNRAAYAGSLSYLSLRGVEGLVGESPTAVYIDDTAVQFRINPNGLTYFGNPYPVTFDLNRVEFDRGPQGTLFGAGALGGSARFIFNQPDLHELSAEAQGEVATTKDATVSYETGVAGGGPLIPDTLGFRASAYYRTDGGYVNRVDPFTGVVVQPNSNSIDTKAFRLAFTAAPTDSLTITASYLYQSKQVHDTSTYSAWLSDASREIFNNGALVQQPSTDEFYLPALNVVANLGFAQLTSVTSYFSRSGSATIDNTHLTGEIGGGFGNPQGPSYPVSYADAGPSPNDMSEDLFTQELRLASTNASARLTWLGGLFYSHRSQHEISNQYNTTIADNNGLPPNNSLLYYETRTIDTQIAAFGQLDFQILDALKATAGVRVARTKTSFTQLAGGLFNTGVPPEGYGELTENPITPKFGVSYQPTSNSLYYVSIAKGYRVGGPNTVLPPACGISVAPSYSSDYLWSYEAGAKKTLFDYRLQANVSVFHLDWANVQQQIFLPCGFGILANAGSASANGFDLEVDAVPTKALHVHFSAAYSKPTYDHDVYYAGQLLVQKGDSVGYLPAVPAPWNLSFSARYDVPLSLSATGYVWVEDIFRGKNTGPFSNDVPGSLGYDPDLVPSPLTNMLNMRVGATHHSLDVSVFLSNVLNDTPNLTKNTEFAGSPFVEYSTFRPRTVGLTAKYNF